MSYLKPAMKTCVCDGRYDGCDHAKPCAITVTDDRWGPWCEFCNPRRLAHITESLEGIKRDLEARSGS